MATIGNGANQEIGDPRVRRRRLLQTLDSAIDRDSIRSRISALTASDRRLWGKMSPHQMVCHQCDVFRLALGKKSATPATEFVQRTVMKWIALRAPMKWPHGIATRPEVEQGVGGTPPVEFERDRAELKSLFERFREASGKISVAHPFFGAMTAWEWQRWGYVHADHHLRQFGR
jgi:Protein of unknown function (DUF1569)